MPAFYCILNTKNKNGLIKAAIKKEEEVIQIRSDRLKSIPCHVLLDTAFHPFNLNFINVCGCASLIDHLLGVN